MTKKTYSINLQIVHIQVVVPQKRAALVLDRLLVALQKALHDGSGAAESRYDRTDRDGPRAAPLRIAHLDESDTVSPKLFGRIFNETVIDPYFNFFDCNLINKAKTEISSISLFSLNLSIYRYRKDVSFYVVC